MALGSDARGILRLVLHEGALLVGIGLLAGLGGLFVLHRFIATQLYGIGAHDPRVIGSGSVVLALASLAAPLGPGGARRARERRGGAHAATAGFMSSPSAGLTPRPDSTPRERALRRSEWVTALPARAPRGAVSVTGRRSGHASAGSRRNGRPAGPRKTRK
jgi:hypothetical protein